MGAPGAVIAAWRERAWARTGLDRLGAHLGETYGVAVTATSELDAGVLRVDLSDGRVWVTRVFSKARPVAAAESDAAVLRHVAQHDFPAERMAVDASAVSVLDGQAVLVTTFEPGRSGRGDATRRLSRLQGDLLGRLHAIPLPADGVATGGAWHGLSPAGGTRAADVANALPLLADAAALHPEHAAAYDALAAELAGLDVHADLPVALTHPDFTGPNMLVRDDGTAVVIDWTGAGIGPRVLALGMILCRGGFGLKHVDDIVGSYRQHVALEPEEVHRLPDAIRAFGLVMRCWGAIFNPQSAPAAAAAEARERAEADAITERVASLT